MGTSTENLVDRDPDPPRGLRIPHSRGGEVGSVYHVNEPGGEDVGREGV